MATAHPQSADLVIEVAVTSAVLDRRRKAVLYARAGVAQYWIVDVPSAVVELLTDPDDEGYRCVATYRVGDLLPASAPGVGDGPARWRNFPPCAHDFR